MKVLERIRSIDVIALLLIASCLMMGAFFYKTSSTRSTLFCSLIGIVTILTVWVWYRFFNRSLTGVARRAFPIILIIMAGLYTFAFPPGSVPDEPVHFSASYYYSNLIGHPENPNLVRSEDVDAIEWGDYISTSIDIEHYAKVKEYNYPFAQSEGEIDSDRMASFASSSFSFSDHLPQTKIPSALGILIAKGLGLSSLWMFYAGRLFNMLFGAALIIAAVRITPVGKNAMMAIALLPMTLHLLGSYSYDAGIIGFSFLLIALLLNAIYSDGVMRKREIAAIIIAACLLAPCKVLYSLIIFLTIAIPNKRFSSRRNALIAKTCMILSPFIIIFFVKFFDLAGFFSVAPPSNEVNIRGEEAGRMYTLHDLITNPSHALGVFFGATPLDKGWFYLVTLVGGSLGWFAPTNVAPQYVVAALLLLLALSAVSSPDDEQVLNDKLRLINLLIVVMGSLAIFFSMWLAWTFVTENSIQGVQGRYFLPLLPLFLLAVRGSAITSKRCLAFVLVASLIAIDTTNIGFILSHL